MGNVGNLSVLAWCACHALSGLSVLLWLSVHAPLALPWLDQLLGSLVSLPCLQFLYGTAAQMVLTSPDSRLQLQLLWSRQVFLMQVSQHSDLYSVFSSHWQGCPFKVVTLEATYGEAPFS